MWNCSHVNEYLRTPLWEVNVQIMACCHQATSYYLSQCWPICVYKYINGSIQVYIAKGLQFIRTSINYYLTHWGWVTHICVSNQTIIGSDNGLLPVRRQVISWTSADILSIEPLGTNCSESLIGIQTFSFKKMHLKMPSPEWRPLCLRPQCVKAVINIGSDCPWLFYLSLNQV